ncbi:MAG: hypothetical protein J6A97_04785 [Clostridia bacterium]|nr:hypothetical protein [Clostridia bacterium]
MRKSKAYIFSLIATGVFASILILYIFICLICSYIPSLILISIPVTAILLSLPMVLIKKLHGAIRVILSSFLLILTLVSFAFLGFWGPTVEFRSFDNAKEINEYYNKNDNINDDFDFEKFGEYKNISNYKYHSMAIFSQEAYTTILKYNENEFEAEKSKIESSYKFYSTPIENEEAEPIFSYEGFSFRVEISDWYPKEMNLVGINEATNEIAFITFYDYDLDTIDDYEEFLEYYCGWRYVIKERN